MMNYDNFNHTKATHSAVNINNFTAKTALEGKMRKSALLLIRRRCEIIPEVADLWKQVAIYALRLRVTKFNVAIAGLDEIQSDFSCRLVWFGQMYIDSLNRLRQEAAKINFDIPPGICSDDICNLYV